MIPEEIKIQLQTLDQLHHNIQSTISWLREGTQHPHEDIERITKNIEAQLPGWYVVYVQQERRYGLVPA